MKTYRGMGSLEAQEKASSLAPTPGAEPVKGISSTAVDKGSVTSLMPYLLHGTRLGLQKAGTRDILTLHGCLHTGETRFALRTAAAIKDGGPYGMVNVGNSTPYPI